MNLASKNTAVLVFIRAQREEAKLKQLAAAPSLRQNIKVISCLNKRVKKISHASNLPVYVISGIHQKGNNFGERLSNSIEQVFQKGYENVIAIGNDCLQLETSIIKAAEQKLQSSNLVLGPDTSGGTYLIGINKCAFHKQHFINLDWQTGALIDTFKEYVKSWGLSCNYLCEASDISSVSDLKLALTNLSRHCRLRKKLYFFIKENLSWSFIYSFGEYVNFACSFPLLRAPPSLSNS